MFSNYLSTGLLKFQVGTLVGCRILFLIKGVPMLHTFDGPNYMKNDKYMKNVIAFKFFHVFLIFHVVGSIKSMKDVYSLDEELNFASNQ